MSMSINSLIANYSYGYQNKLRPNLDKNDDAVWSKSEVNNFARDYEKSTGSKLDVDKLFESYDKDTDGVLGASEIESVYADDALGLSALTVQNQDGDKLTLSAESKDWMSSMSGKQWSSLLSASFKSEQASSLIGNMLPSNNSLFSLSYAITQYGAAQSLSSASSLLSNLTGSI